MILRHAVVTVCLVLLGGPLWAEEAKDNKAHAIVVEGIRAFQAGMLSDDVAVRQATFDRFMPDAQVMRDLFGEDTNLLLPALEKGLKEMRRRTEKFKAEFERFGAIRSITLIDVRAKGERRDYEEVLRLIPKDVPVYRAGIDYEKGSGGSGTYLVVRGRMRFIRGLEVIPEVLRKLKQQEK